MFKRAVIEFATVGMSTRGFRFGGKGGADDIDIPDPIHPDNPFTAGTHSEATKARLRGSSGIQASQLTKYWNEPPIAGPGLIGQELMPLGASNLQAR